MKIGHVDAYNHRSVVGWAADTDHPDVRLEVRVMVNGAEQGRVVADLPREGLRQRGSYGDGAHAFEYVFDPPLAPSAATTSSSATPMWRRISATAASASNRNAARTSACAPCWSPPPAAPAPPC